MATTRAKKGTLKRQRKAVIQTVQDVNCKVVHFTDDLVEGSLATGAKYQKVATKALKRSEPIIEKQVDIIFDTMEMTIEQFQNNSKRFQKLFGITKQVKQAGKSFDKATERLSKMVSTLTDKVEAYTDKVEDEIEEVTKKVTKRGPGRPKKVAKKPVAKKRGPGRPKKTATTTARKRGPGRPRKNAA